MNSLIWLLQIHTLEILLTQARLPEALPVPFFPLHSLPLLRQLNGESTHLERRIHIFQSLLGLAGFQVHVICLLDTCSIWCHSFPEGRWLWIHPTGLFISLGVALQTAGTMFPNLSRATLPWRSWLKGSPRSSEGHVSCDANPTGLLQEGCSWQDQQLDNSGLGTCGRALAWAKGYKKIPSLNRKVHEPVQCSYGDHTGWYLNPIIGQASIFPAVGYPFLQGNKYVFTVVVGRRGKLSSTILIILEHPEVKRM